MNIGLLICYGIAILLTIIFFSLFRWRANIINVVFSLTWIIPFAGVAFMFCFLIAGIFLIMAEGGDGALYIRDTKLNKWLFNTVDDYAFWKDEPQTINE